MKNQFNKQAAVTVAALAIGISVNDSAFAALTGVSFNGYATVNFSITDIAGSTADYSGLEMTGSFMRSGADFPAVYTIATGDGSVVDNNPEILPTPSAVNIGDSFDHTFSLAGSVSDGKIDYDQVAWYDLGFVNNGADPFDITLDFSYDLSTQVQGHDGTTGINITYWDWDTPDVSFSDAISATSVSGLSSDHRSNAVQYSFTLDPGAYKGFGIDLGHSGYLEASPVPLPAAVWPFLTGLAGVGLRKRKRS
ncbi:MAG: VPLPA-CTERM sorting domain-containing protein [Gammaproteobacteria bacterium]